MHFDSFVSDNPSTGGIAHRPESALLTHGFTYPGHAVACAVAIANIDVMEREDLCGRVRSIGPWFEVRLKALGDLPIVGDVRGSHFMVAAPARVGRLEAANGDLNGPSGRSLDEDFLDPLG